MKKQNGRSVYRLDRTSDRFRICPNPECKKEHMVKHRGKDYCSDKCADDHYNFKRRLDNHAEELLTKGGTVSSIADFQSVNLKKKSEDSVFVSQIPDDVWKEKMITNMQILNSLELDAVHGSLYGVQELLDAGFDFNVFSTQGILHNYPKKDKGQYLVYENYRAYRTLTDEILILNTNNLKPRNND